MFLNFVGCGSALNTSLGNNNAFIKKGKSILLIDCGSTTFSRLQSLNLLDKAENIYALITHRHPDHIASLGDLIFYAHYILKTRITILTPDDKNICSLLKYMGVDENLYALMGLKDKHIIDNSDFHITVEPILVPHVDQMDSYGYTIEYNNTMIYYSGDAKDIPYPILNHFINEEIDYIYQDVCSYDYPNNPHLYFERLCELIDKENRKRVFCMHFDESFDLDKVQTLGFKAVEKV